MATYIQGVTDVFPEVDYAAPDYRLLAQALGASQNRYNEGFQRVKSMYTSLLNSPLSSSENERLRELWFKKNNDNIKSLSQVDLGNASNVSNALSTFNSLVEDKEFVTDMSKTKQYANEFQTAQSYKMSDDEKQRKLYNPIIEEDIMLGMSELRSAKRGNGSITGHEVRKFIPVDDLNEYLNKQAESQKLKIEYDEVNGGPYIVTKVNGKETIGSYYNWAVSQMGNKWDEFYKRKGRVETEKTIAGMMQQNPNLTREQALRQYSKEILPAQYFSHQEYIKQLNQEISSYDNLYRQMKNEYGSSVPPEVAEQLSQMSQKRGELKAELTKAKTSATSVSPNSEEVISNFVKNPYAVQMQRFKMNDAKGWATNKALTTAEEKVKINDWYVTQWKNQQDWAMMRARFAHDKELEGMKHKNATELEMAKAVGFASVGANVVTDEALTPRQAYLKHYSENMSTAQNLVKDMSVLTAAANMTVDSKGNITSTIPGGNLNRLQKAIDNAREASFSGKALTSEDKTILNQYSQMIGLPEYSSFQGLMGGIYKAVKTNNSHPYSRDAKTKIGQVVEKLNDLYTLDFNDQKTLAAFAKRSGFQDKILMVNGRYIINPNLDPNDPVLNEIVADKTRWQNATAGSVAELSFDVKDKDKADYSHVSNSINLSTSAGYIKDGKFVQFSAEDQQALRNILGQAGTENYKKFFDAGYKVRMKTINGQQVAQVIIPVNRTGESNALSVENMGLSDDVMEGLAQANSLVMNVPLDRADKITNQGVKMDTRGNIIQTPSISKTLIEMQSQSMKGSGNEIMMLTQRDEIPLPGRYDAFGITGNIYVESSGEIRVTMTKDGKTQDATTGYRVTDLTPQVAQKIESSLVDYVEKLNDQEYRSYAKQREKTQASKNSSWVPIDNYYKAD